MSDDLTPLGGGPASPGESNFSPGGMSEAAQPNDEIAAQEAGAQPAARNWSRRRFLSMAAAGAATFLAACGRERAPTPTPTTMPS